jgi:hypothetical protein
MHKWSHAHRAYLSKLRGIQRILGRLERNSGLSQSLLTWKDDFAQYTNANTLSYIVETVSSKTFKGLQRDEDDFYSWYSGRVQKSRQAQEERALEQILTDRRISRLWRW